MSSLSGQNWLLSRVLREAGASNALASLAVRVCCGDEHLSPLNQPIKKKPTQPPRPALYLQGRSRGIPPNQNRSSPSRECRVDPLGSEKGESGVARAFAKGDVLATPAGPTRLWKDLGSGANENGRIDRLVLRKAFESKWVMGV